jgi:hypothetical protein
MLIFSFRYLDVNEISTLSAELENLNKLASL